MDHIWHVVHSPFVVVFIPLIFFLIVFLTAFGRKLQGPAAIEAESDDGWKNPEPLLVNLPFDIVCKTVAEELPNFSYASGVWQIMNIEAGIPTTIAANLPCLDERDPNNVQRMDIGLITTITDQSQGGPGSTVRMHFIPYEGLDTPLHMISQGTYEHIEKILRTKSGVTLDRAHESTPDRSPNILQSEPLPVVPPEITFPASSGAPTEAVSDFFSDSAGQGDWYPAAAPAAATGPVQAQEPVPVPELVPTPELVPVPEPETIPEQTFVMAPAPLALPLPAPLPVQPVALAPAAADGAEASLCPGCSQPINPSFPFCLYCGKNF